MEEYLGKFVDVVVDRPLGSRHPEHGYVYPVNYGYLPGTLAGDGEPVDVYVLGVFEPVRQYRGRVIVLPERACRDDCMVLQEDAVLRGSFVDRMRRFCQRREDDLPG